MCPPSNGSTKTVTARSSVCLVRSLVWSRLPGSDYLYFFVCVGDACGDGGGSLQEAKEDAEKTPLQHKLDEFGNMLTWIIGIICAAVRLRVV